MAVLIVAALAALASADYSGDKPLTTWEHGVVDGKVMFVTVEDGSAYTKLWATGRVKPNLTQEITINIPNGGKVKMARLYNYYCWSTGYMNRPDEPGLPAEAKLTFINATNNVTVKTCQSPLTDTCLSCLEDTPPDRQNCTLPCRDALPNTIDYGNGVIQYWDTKGQNYSSTTWDYPSGTFAWNVTDLVTTGHNTYIAKIENIDSTPLKGERFVTFGFALLVVYERPASEPSTEETEYWINEGCECLMARTFETPENATTRTVFADRELPTVKKAKLTTVVMCSDGGNVKGTELPLNMVYFNGEEIGPSTAVNDRAIGVDTFTVIKYLQSGDNIAEFQDRNDCEYPSNAILVIKRTK